MAIPTRFKQVTQTRFKKDAPVYLHSLGSDHHGKKYKAEVAGVAIEEEGPYPALYIVRLLEPLDDQYEFDYMAITGACLIEREIT